MKFNKRVDTGSYPFVDTSYFNDLLKDDYHNVYVTFVAIEGDNKEDVWEADGDLFVRIPLTYEQACSFEAEELMKNKLLDKFSDLDDIDMLMYVAYIFFLEKAV